MFERRVLPILLLASVIPAALAPAVAAPGANLPSRFNPRLDGGPVYAADSTTGAVWAAWAYRSRGEFDIAVSVRDAAGVWSEPAFIGRLDGLDQATPAMVADAAGNLYLAFAARQTMQIFLSVHRHGAAEWSAPLSVTPPGEHGFSPALAVVAGRLVIGCRTGDGKVDLEVLPLETDGFAAQGIYDNPDGTDPLGRSGGDGTGSGTGSGMTDVGPAAGGGAGK